MKTKLISLTLTCLIAATALSGCAADAVAPAAATSASTAASASSKAENTATQHINAQEAQRIARENMGFSESEVQYVWVEMTQTVDGTQYKVEFLVGDDEYDYRIDAIDGDILSLDREAENYRTYGVQQTLAGSKPSADSTAAQPDSTPAASSESSAASSKADSAPASSSVQNDTAPTASSSAAPAPAAPAPAAPAGNNDIGREEAQRIALEHAGLANVNVTFVRSHLDYDYGRRTYEVEFFYNGNEYDYDIDASTGEILSYDYDAEYYTPNQPTQLPSSADAAISAEEAKQIALQHAGVSASDAQYLKMEFDHNWGRSVYEFEWHTGWIEYSVDVDANTGDIVGFERDWD